MKGLRVLLLFMFLPIWILAQVSDRFIEFYSSSEDEVLGQIIELPNGKQKVHEIIVVAKDYEATDLSIPNWFREALDYRVGFMEAATFDNFVWEYDLLENNGNCFRNPYPVAITGFAGVNTDSNMLGILAQVDTLYDFNDYVVNGEVKIHLMTIGPSNRGLCGGGVCYTSKDLDENGNYIKVYVIIQSRGVNYENILQVSLHEAAHCYFYFWDMDHNSSGWYDHSGLGAFEVMTSEGFNGIPSPVNPVLRVQKGWITPTQITGNNTAFPLMEFQKNKKVYVYQPQSTTTSVLPTQKFYISLHERDYENNRYYRGYPVNEPVNCGVLIWHTTTDIVSSNFSDWRKTAIDIEAAHGKTNWTTTATTLTNTNVANPLTGRDKLEIRVLSSDRKTILASPYLGTWQGDATFFYTPGQGQEFSVFSNPNSNLIVNSSAENYAQSVTTGFTFNNLRIENGQVKANIKLNDYTVTGNKTLTSGKWHFENGLTIASGATLTINTGAELNFKTGSSIIVNGTLTLNTGVKLNLKDNSSITVNGTFVVNQGDTLKFQEGSSIIVNGTLSTLGSFEHPVFFDSGEASPTSGDWDGLVANPGSTVNLSYTIIKYAEQGLMIEDSDYSVNNSLFGDCILGINVYACTGESVIDNCNFSNNSYAVTSMYAEPIITNCYFVNNGDAVVCWTGNAYLGAVDQYGNNYFEGNDYNIQAVEGGYAFLGRNTCTLQGGNNSFVNSSNTVYHLEAANSSTIIAENNYWGSNPPQTSKFSCDNSSSIDYAPYLFAAPSKSIKSITPPEEIQYNTEINTKGNLEGAGQNENDSFNPEWPLDWQLMYCRNLVMVKKYSKASILLKKIIRDNIDSVQMGFAFNLLKQASKNDHEGLLNYLSNSINGNSEHETFAKIYFADLDKKNAKNTFVNISSNSLTSSRNKEYALASKIIYEAFEEKDLSQAINSFNEFKNLYPNSKSLNLFATLLKQPHGNKLHKEGSTEIVNPVEYALYSNYPNPFNPETKIKYCIAKPGFVTLKVYDILGKEVATLVNGTQKEGEYEVSFNAANLTAGVYIYSLKSGVFSESKKMLLIK
jgi:hypothetical protein